MSLKKKNNRAEEFADKLADIFEPKLSKLPEGEQEKRISSFEQKVAKVYRENRTKVARPSKGQHS